MSGFWVSLSISFWAEMGDKTQLLAMSYTTRYKLRDVLAGVFLGTALVHLLSVAIGQLIARWVSPTWVYGLSALSFFIFAIWTLRGEDDPSEIKPSRFHPIWFVAGTFFLAELGDKTMLAAITLASQWPWFSVWTGATLGMVLADGLAIGVGSLMGKKIPEPVMRWVAALLFFIFAFWNTWLFWESLHPKALSS